MTSCAKCGLPLVANCCPYCASRPTRELGQQVRAERHHSARTNFEQMKHAALSVRGELEYLDWAIALHDVDATRSSVAQMRNLLQRITLACELVELDATDQTVDRERERPDDGTNPKDV